LQIAVGVVGSALVAMVASLHQAASFFVGTLIMVANVTLLGWIWARLLSQKTIAWTVMLIVIKYAVLLGLIYQLAQGAWFDALSAGLGISSFLIPAFIFALQRKG